MADRFATLLSDVLAGPGGVVLSGGEFVEALPGARDYYPHEPLDRYNNPMHPPLNYFREDGRPAPEALKMLTAARKRRSKDSALGLAPAFALAEWQAAAKAHWKRRAQDEARDDVLQSAMGNVLTLVSPVAGVAVASISFLAKGNGGVTKDGINVPVLSQYSIVYNQGMRLLSNMQEFAQGLPIRDYGSAAELDSAAIGITSNLRDMATRLANSGYDAEAQECRDLHLAIESQRGTLGATIGEAVGSIPGAVGGAIRESVGDFIETLVGDGDGEDDERETPWGIIGVAAAAVVGLLFLIR